MPLKSVKYNLKDIVELIDILDNINESLINIGRSSYEDIEITSLLTGLFVIDYKVFEKIGFIKNKLLYSDINKEMVDEDLSILEYDYLNTENKASKWQQPYFNNKEEIMLFLNKIINEIK